MGKTLILIDGHALAYRQFFALERTRMKAADNTPTWAVFGFMKSLFDLLKKVKPDAIAVSFDKGRDTFRLKEYSEYKANRQSMPDSLKEQFSAIVEGVQAMDIPIYEMPGFEADDVIGTISSKAKELGHKTLILTGDQDSFQLVDPEKMVTVLIPSKGELIEYDRERIHEKLGVYPENVIDLKGLQGDSSDNIPGVKGVGAKTAVKLINEYGTLEEIYEHVEEISSPKLKEKLVNDKDMAFKSKYLATICKEVPIEFDFEQTHVSMPDVEVLTNFLKKNLFNSLLRALPEVLSHCCDIDVKNGQEKQEKEAATVEQPQGQLNLMAALEQAGVGKKLEVNGEVINTEEKFEDFFSKLQEQEVFSIDTETTGLNVFTAKLVGLSIGWNPGIKISNNKVITKDYNPDNTETFYIPTGHEEGTQLKEDYVIDRLRTILEGSEIKKILQNAKYDMHILKGLGVDLGGIAMDTMLASYVKDPSYRHGLKTQASMHLGYEMTPIEDLIGKGKQQITMDKVAIADSSDYACADAKCTLELGGYYAENLPEDEQKLLYDIEDPLVPVLVDMEQAGVSIDTPYLKELSDELKGNIDRIETKIFEIAGEKFNVNSPKQVGEILFEKMEIPPKGKVKTKTGYSTSAKVLEDLKNEHPIAALLISHRHYAKLKSTYVDALPALVNPKTGRIHTSFNQAITTTGRLSSSDPNLQNIPIRTEIGNRIRAAFVPADKGNSIIMSADYSQIELRLLAHISGDTTLVNAFKHGEDIHADTASKVFGVPIEEVTSEMRRKAKAVNFGIIYGQTAYGLSESLKIAPGEAKEIIDKYFETYPKVREYMFNTIKEAKEKGYAQTIYGRKRRLADDLNSRIRGIREFAERAAINSPLQGTAADMMKIATIKTHEALKGFKSKIILQVHDELVLEVPKAELEEVKTLVVKSMELDQPLKVPLVVDVACGESWLEVKE